MESHAQMPECSEISLMLGAAGDGELEPTALQQVAHHLGRCAACTGELSDYSRIGRELKALAAKPPLEGFTKSVLDLIATLVAVAILAIALHGGIFSAKSTVVARSVPQIVASKPAVISGIARPKSTVEVSVDSAFVVEAGSGAFSSMKGRTESGKMIVFSLPGGKTLHVRPRAIVGNMIAMEVVLFDGKQTAMTADLNLESGDTFALTGEQYGAGTLVIRISPTTTAAASHNPQAS